MRRLADIQERAAERPDDSRLRDETKRGAERAVEEEIIPKIVRQILGKALQEAATEVHRIAAGKFKNSAEENMVLRHKPMRADHDEFLNLVGEEYGGWVGEIHAILDDPQLRRG
jgi:hypothetical protein